MRPSVTSSEATNTSSLHYPANTYSLTCSDCTKHPTGWCTFHWARYIHEKGKCTGGCTCFFCPPHPFSIQVAKDES